MIVPRSFGRHSTQYTPFGQSILIFLIIPLPKKSRSEVVQTFEYSFRYLEKGVDGCICIALRRDIGIVSVTLQTLGLIQFRSYYFALQRVDFIEYFEWSHR